MAESPEAVARSTRAEVSTRLAERIPLILDLWEERVRLKLPAARDQDPPILRDDLPPFLLALARSLSPVAAPEDAGAERQVSRSHGAQRARLEEYSLDQVLREYYLLRKTVLEVLDAELTVALPEREAIVDRIEQAMQEAATQFMRAHQQALQQRESLLRAVLDHCPLLVALKDAEGRFLLVNRHWVAAFGLENESVRGKTDAELFAADRAAAGIARDREALETGEPIECEEHVPHRAGTRTYLTIRFPVVGPDGGVAVLGSIAADITERKRMEADLSEHAAELGAADQRKDEFLATLAHELRNPLSPMLAATHLLRERGLQDAAVFGRSIAIVERQVRHMARLVEDLLDLSRIARGKVELRRAPAEVRTLVEVALSSCRSFIEERGHQLSVTLPPEPVWLDVDATRIEQVLMNLLNNAAKYTEPGGRIELTVELEGGPGAGDPDGAPAAGQAVIRVRDTGIGIAAQELPHVFELFRQADEGVRQSQGGLGIGLNLVCRLVELHAGSVEAASAGRGQGSEFRVRLPLMGTEEVKR